MSGFFKINLSAFSINTVLFEYRARLENIHRFVHLGHIAEKAKQTGEKKASLSFEHKIFCINRSAIAHLVRENTKNS